MFQISNTVNAPNRRRIVRLELITPRAELDILSTFPKNSYLGNDCWEQMAIAWAIRVKTVHISLIWLGSQFAWSDEFVLTELVGVVVSWSF